MLSSLKSAHVLGLETNVELDHHNQQVECVCKAPCFVKFKQNVIGRVEGYVRRRRASEGSRFVQLRKAPCFSRIDLTSSC